MLLILLRSANTLCGRIGQRRFLLLLVLLPIMLSVNHYLKHQTQVLANEARSLRLIDNKKSWILDEFRVSLLLSLALSLLVAMLALAIGRADVSFALTAGVTQLFSSLGAGLFGVVGPTYGDVGSERFHKELRLLASRVGLDLVTCAVLIGSAYLFIPPLEEDSVQVCL